MDHDPTVHYFTRIMIPTCPFESCHTVPTFVQRFQTREKRETLLSFFAKLVVTDFTESIWHHALNFEIQIPLLILSQFLHLARVVEKLCVSATSGGDGDYTH
ncbi:hypothetical protein HanPSC8_Chr05g0202261 [Helianthus annuus]|nr:hypothetical protein HanPSC8_Chr05g0202261 [Helianthus annuus]